VAFFDLVLIKDSCCPLFYYLVQGDRVASGKLGLSGFGRQLKYCTETFKLISRHLVKNKSWADQMLAPQEFCQMSNDC
jgi:hypothetical protein